MLKKMKASKNTHAYIFTIKLLSSLWITGWTIRMNIIGSVILTLLMIVSNAATPLVLKHTVTLLSRSNYQTFSSIPLLLLVYGFLWTLSQSIAQVRDIIFFRIMERCVYILSLRIFDHLQSLSMRFHLDRRTGEIAHIISRSQVAFSSIMWGLLFIVPMILEIALATVVLFHFYGLLYSMLLLLILISYVLFSLFANTATSKIEDISNEKEGRAASYIVDSLLNAETVKYFNNQQYEQQQCTSALREREKALIAEHNQRQFVLLGQGIIAGLGLSLLTWLSGKAVMSGSMQVSDFVLINGYLLQFIFPLIAFSFYVRTLQKNINIIQEISKLFLIKPEITDAPHALTFKASSTEIAFSTVSFSYDERRPILQSISFRIPAGKTLAIVGSTGAGKSTISRLLFRLYDVTSGSISINGHDIRSVTQQSLQEAIGVVSQDTVLFNNTIYYNIAYGQPNASFEEIEQAVKLAHLKDFIHSLPEGYQTMVGERGLKLSGGEKQRIAIARVILKKPLIYVFDEATSSLDTATEKEIQYNLEAVAKGATTLIIAHRLSTVIHADEIIVLDHGKIVEQGAHQVLLEQNTFYSYLWHKQAQHNDKVIR
jgi:ATP-binding cassette, subfamily B, heavy metal transporter